MKRGGTLRRHKRLNAVSAKVKAGRPEYDALYATVDARSGGRCQVILPVSIATPDALISRRCPPRGAEHHHTRTPRRTWHHPTWVMHICRAHHNDVTATFQN